MAILAPAASDLQKLLIICEEFANEHDLVFNCNKSWCMCILPKCSKIVNIPSVTLQNTRILYVNTFKYLGVFINDNCSDDDDNVKRQLRSLYARSIMLRKKFFNCSEEVKAKLYTTYCSNLYCAQLWWNHKNASARKLEIAHDSGFKYVLGMSRYERTSPIFVTLNVPSYQEVYSKALYGFHERMTTSKNPLVQNTMNFFLNFEFSFHENLQGYVV